MRHFIVGICLLATLVGLVGCGADPSSTIGSLSPEQINSALDAVGAKLDEVASLNPDDATAAIEAFAKTLPGVSSTQNQDNTVWVKFSDGTVIGIINNRDGPDFQPDTARTKIADPVQKFATPDAEQARLVRCMGTYYISPVPAIAGWLANGGYNVSKVSGSIENLKNVTGDGVFYIDTHGSPVPANILPFPKDADGNNLPDDGPHFALWTTTEFTTDSIEANFADLRAGNLIFGVAPNDAAPGGKAIFAKHYLITDRFIRAYHWSFAPQSVAFINACSSDNAVIKQAFFDAGVGFYLGWTAPAGDGDAFLAARFFFDRVLGVNKTSPSRTPPQRPFTYSEVWAAMKRVTKDTIDTTIGPFPYNGLPFDTSKIVGQSRGVDVVGKNVPKLILSSPEPANGILVPCLINITIDEANDQIILNGSFGEDQGEVFVNGSSLAVTSWGGSAITCSVPRTGGTSAGEVYVVVRGHQSNTRRLTSWTGQYRNHFTGSESLFIDHTWNVRFRGDVGSYRSFDAVDLPVTQAFVPTYATKDATVSWNTGGSYTYFDAGIGQNVTEQWVKAVDHPITYRIPSASSLQPNNFDFRVSFNLTANTLIIGTSTYINDAYYDQLSNIGGQGNLSSANTFRGNRNTDGSFRAAMTGGSFDIPAGSTTYPTSGDSTFSWDTIPAVYPPDPQAPQ